MAQTMIKAGMNQSTDMFFAEALAFEAHCQTICLGSDDAAEGIKAFLEKRPPEFTGR